MMVFIRCLDVCENFTRKASCHLTLVTYIFNKSCKH